MSAPTIASMRTMVSAIMAKVSKMNAMLNEARSLVDIARRRYQDAANVLEMQRANAVWYSAQRRYDVLENNIQQDPLYSNHASQIRQLEEQIDSRAAAALLEMRA